MGLFWQKDRLGRYLSSVKQSRQEQEEDVADAGCHPSHAFPVARLSLRFSPTMDPGPTETDFSKFESALPSAAAPFASVSLLAAVLALASSMSS